MTEPSRIVFAGTPEFAAVPLKALIKAGYAPQAVYCQPDRPSGRGRKLRPGPVKQVAVAHNLPVIQPLNFSAEADRRTLRDLAPDLLIVVAYGLILPREVLDIPQYGGWNIHASLLPRWRGAAPIQRAIEAGDEATGVCIMQMDEGLDTGPVYYRLETAIGPDDTSAALHDRLAGLGASALLECLSALAAGNLEPPVPQAAGEAVYAAKISKAEAELDWNRPAATLQRQVNAFNPWPVAWFMHAGKRLRVWRALALPGECGNTPGLLLGAGADGIDFATADGIFRITELQPEGGRRMHATDFLNAHPLS